MPNSQEQSLDEGVVFLEVSEASPEFLYCETQRQALERLLNAGPEAFYGSIGTERSGCFLSPEEVRQITGWTQDYRFSQLQREDTEVDGADAADLCSTYFPGPSDAPAPVLDLGWPEKAPWTTGGGSTRVAHTCGPHVWPADCQLPTTLRLLIAAVSDFLCLISKVIAIVTDRLTDGAIMGDLHAAASRSVPVYVILNQRSIHENFTLNRLRHPNMRVRCLGGKSFSTGVYIYKDLITVLRGPVVEAFDREFRILFAASLPVADTLRAAGSHEDVKRRLKDLSELRLQKRLPAESEMISPPSPPPDSHLDWEPQLSPSRPLNKGPNVAVSELSQSLVDLSVHRADLNPEDRDVPAPRLRASVSMSGN
uniref:Family with sequence similarity 83 member E n=1 Tax=Cynoglossus semilaevis TaxID=244447 RepID=A0A3P8X682_CYNSE